jgi:very-short-patch-repair endonuclease
LAQVSSINDFRQKKAEQPPKSPIERLLADARLRLVETGTRNRLVHTPRGGKRTRSLPILSAEADGLFEALTRPGRTSRFQPADASAALEGPAEGSFAPRKPGGAAAFLRTNLAEEPLAKRLLTIFRDAKTAEEEQGINILFLAIGFLRWYEDDKLDVMREAPLVLLPVSLIRDPRRSIFDLAIRDEDVATNQAIQERLRTDFGIALPALPETDEWRPTEYFAVVRDAIAIKPRWSIDPNGVELGFYSFSKLLMIRDLEPAAWGDKPIIDHPLLRALLSEGFREEPLAIAHDARLDTLYAPADLVQVVDADSSQTIVIETVRAGRNLVVQGPPGTGKSQTITNMIASAVHDGKSVLFVAEKMAALDVVHARLRRAGLGPVCLELHSRGANKRAVLAEVESTLEHHAIEPDAQAEAGRLTELRATLNAVDARMHAPIGDTGLTPFQALSRLVAAAEAGVASHPALLADAAKWSAGGYGSVVEAAARLSEITATAGPCFNHPYHGVEARQLQPSEFTRLMAPIAALAEAAIALAQWAETIAGHLGIATEISLEACATLLAILRTIEALPVSAAEMAEALPKQNLLPIVAAAKSGLALNDLKNALAGTFIDAAWETPAAALRLSLTSGLSFFGRFGGTYRNASKTLGSMLKIPLPKKAHARIELADRLIEFAKHRADLAAEDRVMGAMLPLHWRGEKTDFPTLHTAALAVLDLSTQTPQPRIEYAIALAKQNLAKDHIDAVTRLVERLNHAADAVFPILKVDLPKAFQATGRDRVPLRSLAAKAYLWRDSAERFDEWRRLAAADARLRDLSGAVLADALANGAVPPDMTNAVLECTFAEAVWAKARAAAPELQDFYGPRHDAIAGEFRALEAKRRVTTAKIIQGRHAATMPRGNYGAMNIIRSEVSRKRGHMPIRKLFKAAGETLQRIKPVLLMSPISVAQFLPPGSVEFDLLVIDEASQVRPEDALGLVGRAKQIVVVGDNKQLPPTSFFDRIMADDEDNDETDDETSAALAGAAKATDLESILALCEARGLNSAMLRWHYRSRHPSLIEVSNAEFYKHLIMPPAPSAERLTEGLILRRVAGAYDRGGKRINAIEAETIANAVAIHARQSPQLSLGIVTFSTAQRDAIGDLLDIKRRTDDTLDAFLREGKAEDVFVKNLENVQGDERDVIMVSVGYGPRTAGARLDSMAFGPVSGEGGERRLNVLFTRARTRCEIFCSFAAGDVDPDRAKGEGARILKRFLQYAETGQLEERVSTSEDADSPFEETVAAAMEALGYKVDKQVGSAGFKIDLAVRHPDQPGRYMLAVECDGATYHRALWARERDRLRQEILENLGWRFHRIWSTDWFYRRGEVMQKLRAALEDAKAAIPSARQTQAAKAPEPAPVQAPAPRQPSRAATGPQILAYKQAVCSTPRGVEPHQVKVEVMAAITRHIVEVEGPIHVDEIARRVTSLFGKARTGSLISDASLRSLQFLRSPPARLIVDGAFWMTPEQHQNPPVRDRSAAPPTLQRADMLSPHEIRAAAKIAVQENGSLADDDMANAITRLLGFKRTGPELKAVILKALVK